MRMLLHAKRRTVTASSESSSEKTKEDEEKDEEEEELEPWKDFLKRTAQWAEEQLEKAQIQQWTVLWRKRKWQFAGKLLEASNEKWSAAATKWHPLIHSNYLCGRRQARPKRRWEQDFVEYLETAAPQDSRKWQEFALDPDWWLSEADAFASFMA